MSWSGSVPAVGRGADDLVQRVVTADVLAHQEQARR